MKIRTLPVVLAVMGALVVTCPVVAETPNIRSVSLECKIVRGEHHTVKVQLQPPYMFNVVVESNQFNFRNASGQTFSFLANPTVIDLSFPVPAGTYKLTIDVVHHSNLDIPVSNSSSAVYNPDIVVPPTMPLAGRGTGCKFG